MPLNKNAVKDTVEDVKNKVLGKKKERPNRKYHDGDIVQFDFEQDSLDIYKDVCKCQTLMGIISGVIYQKDGIYYKVQLSDKKRNISGDFVVHEDKINRKME